MTEIKMPEPTPADRPVLGHMRTQRKQSPVVRSWAPSVARQEISPVTLLPGRSTQPRSYPRGDLVSSKPKPQAPVATGARAAESPTPFGQADDRPAMVLVGTREVPMLGHLGEPAKRNPVISSTRPAERQRRPEPVLGVPAMGHLRARDRIAPSVAPRGLTEEEIRDARRNSYDGQAGNFAEIMRGQARPSRYGEAPAPSRRHVVVSTKKPNERRDRSGTADSETIKRAADEAVAAALRARGI